MAVVLRLHFWKIEDGGYFTLVIFYNVFFIKFASISQMTDFGIKEVLYCDSQ